MFGKETRKEWVFAIDPCHKMAIEDFMNSFGIRFESLSNGAIYRDRVVVVYRVMSTDTILPTIDVIHNELTRLNKE